jgi:fructose 1,6-bisphosphatase
MNTPGLILSPQLAQGFRFVIMDVSCTEGDRMIELDAPEQLYDIAALLRDAERYVVESIWSRATGTGGCGGNIAVAQHCRKVHRQGRSGDAGAHTDELPGDR